MDKKEILKLKEKFENILINEPDNKEALFSLAALFYNLGNLYLKEKKINIAIKNYLKSIKVDKEFVHSYYNLGIAYKEKEHLNKLAQMGELQAYHHKSFWHPMDTLRDQRYLDDLWNNNESPWKTWK